MRRALSIRDGIAAAIRERMGLLRLSRERVRTELLRILVAPRAGEAIEVMEETGCSSCSSAASRGAGASSGFAGSRPRLSSRRIRCCGSRR